jgi:hypothetical protein
MIKSALFVACAGVLCLAAAPEAAAEPISVLSGSLVFPTGASVQTGPLSLIGTRGFSVVGGIDTGENGVGPINECLPCPASTTLVIGGAKVTGGGFVDTNVTFEGRTFLNVGGTSGENGDLILGISGTVFVPAVGQSPIVLTAPFTLFESSFRPPEAINEVPIRGGGVATIGLEPRFGFWELQNVRFEFVPQPTPEPATLMLIGGGLAGIAFRNRTRRRV